MMLGLIPVGSDGAIDGIGIDGGITAGGGITAAGMNCGGSLKVSGAGTPCIARSRFAHSTRSPGGFS